MTRQGYNWYWTLVEDRLDAASYSPELNWPMLEEAVTDDAGFTITQDELDEAVAEAVDAAMVDVIDELVTTDDLNSLKARLLELAQ